MAKDHVTGVQVIEWECPECEEVNTIDGSNHAPCDVMCEGCGEEFVVDEIISYWPRRWRPWTNC